MKVAVLGSGAYGIALAKVVHENKFDCCIWTKFETELNSLKKTRTNKFVLPDVKIPRKIKITCDLELALKDAELIIVAVPAGALDSVFSELKNYYKKSQHICIASKGIEQNTCHFAHDILKRHIDTDNYAVISGPSFAIDIISHDPIGLTIASDNDKSCRIISKAFQNSYLRLRRTNDVVGVEICGSIKNVIAIASGMLKGMGYSESASAMLITESLHDIKGLIKALGGEEKTILSYAGFGDLLLTATSPKSRNYQFGYMIGSKASSEEIKEYRDTKTIEGLYTLKSIYKLIKDKKVDLPIIDLIKDIIYNDEDPIELCRFLIKKD